MIEIALRGALDGLFYFGLTGTALFFLTRVLRELAFAHAALLVVCQSVFIESLLRGFSVLTATLLAVAIVLAVGLGIGELFPLRAERSRDQQTMPFVGQIAIFMILSMMPILMFGSEIEIPPRSVRQLANPKWGPVSPVELSQIAILTAAVVVATTSRRIRGQIDMIYEDPSLSVTFGVQVRRLCRYMTLVTSLVIASVAVLGSIELVPLPNPDLVLIIASLSVTLIMMRSNLMVGLGLSALAGAVLDATMTLSNHRLAILSLGGLLIAGILASVMLPRHLRVADITIR